MKFYTCRSATVKETKHYRIPSQFFQNGHPAAINAQGNGNSKPINDLNPSQDPWWQINDTKGRIHFCTILKKCRTDKIDRKIDCFTSRCVGVLTFLGSPTTQYLETGMPDTCLQINAWPLNLLRAVKNDTPISDRTMWYEGFEGVAKLHIDDRAKMAEVLAHHKRTRFQKCKQELKMMWPNMKPTDNPNRSRNRLMAELYNESIQTQNCSEKAAYFTREQAGTGWSRKDWYALEFTSLDQIGTGWCEGDPELQIRL